jgi:WD40 repeat protein
MLIDTKHPNSIAFDEDGRLFIGDSFGQINTWRVEIIYHQVTAVEHFLIKHKEIDGDQINNIIIHTEKKNQFYVQSRDNCIRLIEYETNKGPRIKKRFFGAKCSKLMVQCAISPDG